MSLLLVLAGAAVGAPLRYLSAHFLDGEVPWGTLVVNLVGSFLLGWLVGVGVGANAMTLLGVGFCGAMTTYSAVVVQSTQRGPRGLAYAVCTVLLCLGTAWLGLRLG